MRVIHKYQLDIFNNHGAEFFDIVMSEDAEVLHIDKQFTNIPQLWALTNPYDVQKPRRIWVFATGVPMTNAGNSKLRHIETLQFHGGGLVLHFFEELPQ